LDILSQEMRKIPVNPFSIVLDLEFSNDPHTISAIFDRFIEEECSIVDLKFVYTEMNCFYLNTDSWYFGPYGFTDMIYLSEEDFGSFDYESIEYYSQLTGMESLQDVYKNHREQEDYAKWICTFLVASKFHKLIKAAADQMRHKLPIVADAHDVGFSGRIS
ncbi:MAG: hypothetical protein RIC04_14110, partial [Parvibaculum sp.]|uniref:hypothetical protein n=1 Tax=Parvibaculum sp. TaxID=2024848 RepID=UPI0032EB45CB